MMVGKVAIVAHFDIADQVDLNFLCILKCLERVFDAIVVVTTSNVPTSAFESLYKTTLIVRPNIGYDFYSYRVGMHHATQQFPSADILFLNSSFYLLSEERFGELLLRMSDEVRTNDVVALTQSEQIKWHVQSFVFMLSTRAVSKKGVQKYFSSIEPLNTKFEVILNYEIGFSEVIAREKLVVKVIYEPSAEVDRHAKKVWRKVIARSASLKTWISGRILHSFKGVNWTHFGAQELATRYGLVKAEVLRTNPHNVDTSFLSNTAFSTMLGSVQTALSRSNGAYKLHSDGLSSLVTAESALPSYRSVSYHRPGTKGVRIAVVVHLYYYDLLAEILLSLHNIVEPFDLFVTTPHEADVAHILNACSRLAVSVTVRISENKGRDIGPFMTLFLDHQLDSYLAVLKLHSKKSTYSDLGGEWRRKLYGSLMGNSFLVRKVISHFETGVVGIIGPHDFYLSDEQFWGANRDTVKRILVGANVLDIQEESTLGFFAGSMFWFSPRALRSLQNLPEGIIRFEAENGMQDGTMAHALERVFCPIARATGYITTSIPLGGGIEIDGTPTANNRVPVL